MIRHTLMLAALALPPAVPGSTGAQALGTIPRYSAFEGFVARADLDPALGQLAGGLRRTDGVGGRLLFRIDAPQRLAVGGTLAYAPGEQQRGALWYGGIEADLHPVASPLFGRVDPIVSLGGGMLRLTGIGSTTIFPPSASTSVTIRPGFCLRPMDVANPGDCGARATASDGATSVHDFAAVSPALGARIGVLPGFALRVDARDIVAFDRTPHHVRELTTGISLLR